MCCGVCSCEVAGPWRKLDSASESHQEVPDSNSGGPATPTDVRILGQSDLSRPWGKIRCNSQCEAGSKRPRMGQPVGREMRPLLPDGSFDVAFAARNPPSHWGGDRKCRRGSERV